MGVERLPNENDEQYNVRINEEAAAQGLSAQDYVAQNETKSTQKTQNKTEHNK